MKPNRGTADAYAEKKQCTYGPSDWFTVCRNPLKAGQSRQSQVYLDLFWANIIRYDVSLANSRAPGVWFVHVFSMQITLVEQWPGVPDLSYNPIIYMYFHVSICRRTSLEVGGIFRGRIFHGSLHNFFYVDINLTSTEVIFLLRKLTEVFMEASINFHGSFYLLPRK